MRLVLLLSLSSFFLVSTNALRFPLTRRAPPPSPRSSTVSVNQNYSSNFGFTDDDMVGYSVTIYVQGQPFQVRVDTGSADLWIDTTNVTLPGLTDTGTNATISYVDTTEASGPITLANVTLGDFTVTSQALISAYVANASDLGFSTGLLGVGPPFASQIVVELAGTSFQRSSAPFMSNLFHQNPNDVPFVTFLLSRSFELISEGGAMTIGELVEGYTDVVDQPKLPVISNASWQVFMDGVYVNGELFTGHGVSTGLSSAFQQPKAGQTTMILDTGSTLGSAPSYYVDAMYKNVPGAQWSDEWMTYQVSCDTKINISMALGGQEYPMNPIDATWINVNDDGSFDCFGAFSYSAADADSDWILGDTFMHNVYSVFYYGGNFTGTGNADSYLQVLSITNKDEAWAEFDWLNVQRIVQQELAAYIATPTSEVASQTATYALTSVPSTSTPQTTSTAATNKDSEALAADVAGTPSASTAPLSDDWSELLRNSYIIIGLLGAVLLLLVGVLIKLVLSARNGRYKQVPTVVPPMHFEKPYEPESEAFTTPYDDLARPLP
ncbi:uncharacterized protein FIBRA_00175 [Fibroporia radiculosa]|uniref:Peptidase A1 domain-containing protein n=1 Tax=Fibroporia radiculosa TaxID=599839 RepID=J7SBW7_9APHY|nr:uncharacterized protein FIBRA_00175 [Fibroporia radiculosa]CCL98181.1 predicted protein [Fibroporia radiculosa]